MIYLACIHNTGMTEIVVFEVSNITELECTKDSLETNLLNQQGNNI